jgi:arylsulfatase A-like enzyme
MFGGMSDHDRVPLRPYDPAGIFPAESVFYEKGFSTDLFREAAVGFLEKAPPDRPFCLYVAFTAPHDPRTPPAAYAVDPAGIGLPPNAQAMHPFDNGDMLVRDEQLEAMPRPADAVRRHLADYYGMIAHLDAAVGKILEALAASGHAEDTIVVYTADHGLALGQHGLMGKQSLYEHSLRVPLILSGPGIPAGRRHGQLVWHADTCATLLDQAGLDPDPASEGRSLLPVLRGDGPWERRTLAAGYRATQRMMRDERYKLIRYFQSEAGSGPLQAESPPTPGSRTEQLFDLAVDPWETVNLACVPELRAVRDRLAEALARWQAEAGDPFLDRCS